MRVFTNLSTRKRVAIVRGSTINPWEMQGFAPLKDRFDLQAVGAGSVRARHGDMPFPTVWLTEESERVERIPISQIRWRMRQRLNEAGRQHALKDLEAVLRGYDVVHTVDFHYAFSEQSAACCERSGVPLVVTRWENVPFMYWRFGGEAVRQRCARVARSATRILATSRGAADSLMVEGTETGRIEVIYPGVDVDRFAPGPIDAQAVSYWGTDPDAPRILFIGRLCWEKGVLDLLLALQALRTTHPRATLLVVGEGPDGELLADATARLGLSDAVRFCRLVPYAEVPHLYRSADVFVLASQATPGWEEQFGMVLVEAMASGTAIVSTRSGAIPEIVGEGGVLVTPHVPAELADALRRLLTDRSQRLELGQQARARALAQFDSRIFAARVAEVYGELTG